MEKISNTFFFPIWEFNVIADPTMGGFRYNPPNNNVPTSCSMGYNVIIYPGYCKTCPIIDALKTNSGPESVQRKVILAVNNIHAVHPILKIFMFETPEYVEYML